MDRLQQETYRLKTAIALYDSALAEATGAWREQLLFHRNWDLRILADLSLRTKS